MAGFADKGKLVDTSELSLGRPPSESTKLWMSLFKGIPRGKTFVTTDKDMGVSLGTVRSILTEYQRKGWASRALHVSYRSRKDGSHDIYIIHDLPKEKESKEASK